MGVLKVVRQQSALIRSVFLQDTVTVAMTGVAQLAMCSPVKQKATGSVPSQGTCLGSGFGSDRGTYERQVTNDFHIDVVLPLFLSPFHTPKNQ